MTNFFSNCTVNEYFKNLIEQGNIIILLDYGDYEFLKVLSQKVLVYSKKVEIITYNNDFFESTIIHKLQKHIFNELKNIYYIYEFSDQVILISNDEMYPNMFNYVRQGILTEEDMIDALLYKIGGTHE